MNHLPVLALVASAPFMIGIDPASAPVPSSNPPAPATIPAPAVVIAPPPASPPSAATPQPAAKNLQSNGAAAKPAAPGTNGALSNLVADAIKRKLERVASKASGAPDNATPPTDVEPAAPAAAPDPAMMGGGARLMMGSPTDGSPAYIRVAGSPQAPGAAPTTQAPHTQPAPSTPVNPPAPAAVPAASNPLARPIDPMEAGTDTAAAVAQPGANHNSLDIFVGTWDVSANFDAGAGQPTETASGQMINSWQLDGRWLKQEYSGQMASLGAFRGLGFLGYDNLQKSFVATWMDTLSTSCLVSKGSFDQSRGVFTFSGDFSVPGSSDKYKQKQVMTILSPDRYVVTMYLTGPDGVEFKTGNLEYTRSIKTMTGVPAR